MKTTDSEILRHIIDAIVSGRLRAGDRVFEPMLCEQFEVSRTPVRQALTRLVQEGILEKTEGQRGYSVPLLTPEDMEEAFTAREAVEGQIAYLACRNATSEDLDLLIKANEAERMQFEQFDKAHYAASNEGFHFHLALMSRNRYLIRYYKNLFWRTQLYIFHFGGFYTALNRDFLKERSELSFVEHRALIDVLAAGDPDKAREAAVAHIRSTKYNRLHPGSFTPDGKLIG